MTYYYFKDNKGDERGPEPSISAGVLEAGT
jgi:hypothetical protein